MNLESERALAQQRMELFQSRFKGQDDTFDPICLARSWLDAVMKVELNPLELVQIRDEAKSMQNQFDIGFFTFCNDIDGVVKEMTHPLGA